jgi:maleate isomerase
MRPAGTIRSKWATIIPSTNIMVEHDFARLCPYGVTFHAGRAYISHTSMETDADAKALLDDMDAGFATALRDTLTVKPDRIVIAMAAEVMRRGVAGGQEFVDQVAQQTGLPVTTGPGAVLAALRRIDAKRVCLLTPYQPESDQLTRAYFEECGFEVVHIEGLRATSATNIAEVSQERIVAALRDLDARGADVLVQVGTNLNASALAASAEHWLSTPFIAMNVATVWHALRESGITDQRGDAGFLLRDH